MGFCGLTGFFPGDGVDFVVGGVDGLDGWVMGGVLDAVF